jgi:hypothetical protein
MAEWADTNPTDFYTKLFPKMISRSQQVDVSGTLTIDDAITRLERQGAVIENGAPPFFDDDFSDDEIPKFYDL